MLPGQLLLKLMLPNALILAFEQMFKQLLIKQLLLKQLLLEQMLLKQMLLEQMWLKHIQWGQMLFQIFCKNILTNKFL
jgi:hypothetical protein